MRDIKPAVALFWSLVVFYGCGGSGAQKAGVSGSPVTEAGTAQDGNAQDADARLSTVDASGSDPARGDSDVASGCTRRVLVQDVSNARDLGGQPLAGGRKVACGTVFVGGALSELSETGCTEFAALGVKTLIDLREQAAASLTPEPDCATRQATSVSAAFPKLLPDTPEHYLALFGETQSVVDIFSILGQAESYPVYIHCVIGRDRACFVAALILAALGATRQTIIDEFMLSEQAGVEVKQECIEAMLDEIDKQGGITAWLSSLGVTEDQLDVLREQAIAH